MSDPIRCRDGCGRSVADMDAAFASAWQWLEISKGWRCPGCAHELMQVNRVECSRSCSVCGWTLPAQYGGYVGPCPDCSGVPLPT